MNSEHQKEIAKLSANNKVVIRKIIVYNKKSKNKGKIKKVFFTDARARSRILH